MSKVSIWGSVPNLNNQNTATKVFAKTPRLKLEFLEHLGHSELFLEALFALVTCN